jgi:hypothetical protein
MNFGQPIAGHIPVPYALVLSVTEFRFRMDETYRRCRQELREDLGVDDPEQDEVSLGLLRADWPDLDALLREHRDLAASLIRRYMFVEVLGGYTRASIVDYDYLLTSLDAVRVGAEEIILAGCCYATRVPPPAGVAAW